MSDRLRQDQNEISVEEKDNTIIELRAQLRETAQILIEKVGADGPCSAKKAAKRAVKKIKELTEVIEQMKSLHKVCTVEEAIKIQKRVAEWYELREEVVTLRTELRDARRNLSNVHANHADLLKNRNRLGELYDKQEETITKLRAEREKTLREYRDPLLECEGAKATLARAVADFKKIEAIVDENDRCDTDGFRQINRVLELGGWEIEAASNMIKGLRAEIKGLRGPVFGDLERDSEVIFAGGPEHGRITKIYTSEHSVCKDSPYAYSSETNSVYTLTDQTNSDGQRICTYGKRE